jgi:hypothetical protein
MRVVLVLDHDNWFGVIHTIRENTPELNYSARDFQLYSDKLHFVSPCSRCPALVRPVGQPVGSSRSVALKIRSGERT